MEQKLTKEEITLRRIKFFTELNKEYPPVRDFVATNSGMILPIPDTQEDWEDYHENLQLVEGIQ